MNTRNIISALNPWRYRDSYTEIWLTVWFEELSESVPFVASLFDCERHGKELWIRAMAGEYGEITVIDKESPPLTKLEAIDKPRLLTYSGDAT